MDNPVKELEYIYNPDLFNAKAAEIIVPLILKYFDAKNVIDVGCGLGTWLSVFKKHGLEIQGVDGMETENRNLWIDESEFKIHDFRESLKLDKKYDLAISLEVAEHLPESVADQFVDLLTESSDQIIFSAAIPGQTTGHINEQWPSYWIKRFEAKGYTALDLIRPEVWENENVETYYRQNIIVLVKDEAAIKLPNYCKNRPLDLVHPTQFVYNQKQLQTDLDIYRSGSIGVLGSLKMLKTALFRKLNP